MHSRSWWLTSSAMPPPADPSPVDPRRAGQDALRAGRLGEAIGLLRTVMAADPADGEARIWLGQALVAGGHTFEGCASLRDGARLLCETAPERALPVAGLLQQQGDAAGALALARIVADRCPAAIAPLTLIATAAAQTGAPEAALAALDRARELGAGGPALEILAASLESDLGRSEAALARLDALPAPGSSPGLTAADGFRAAKERARAADRAGRAEAAMAAVRDAAALAAQVPAYAGQDRGRVPGILAADAAAFDADRLRRWRADGPADEDWSPLFLIGFLRSGTTLMQEILATDPCVRVADEEPILAATVQAFEAQSRDGPGSRLARLDRLDRPARAALRGHYRKVAAMRTGSLEPGHRLVDKFTLNAIDLPVILRLFPEAPILFMVRDPRDACVSACLQLMAPGPSTVHMLALDDAARFHAALARQWRLHRDALGLHASEVRYEALVGDLERTMHRALAGTGIGWSEAMRDFHRSSAGRTIASPSRAQVRQPLSAAKVAHWHRYAAALAPCADLFAPAVDDWGY